MLLRDGLFEIANDLLHGAALFAGKGADGPAVVIARRNSDRRIEGPGWYVMGMSDKRHAHPGVNWLTFPVELADMPRRFIAKNHEDRGGGQESQPESRALLPRPGHESTIASRWGPDGPRAAQ